jgi:hypothetical protein
MRGPLLQQLSPRALRAFCAAAILFLTEADLLRLTFAIAFPRLPRFLARPNSSMPGLHSFSGCVDHLNDRIKFLL